MASTSNIAEIQEYTLHDDIVCFSVTLNQTFGSDTQKIYLTFFKDQDLTNFLASLPATWQVKYLDSWSLSNLAIGSKK